jgi:predicted nucleic acid-binding protein
VIVVDSSVWIDFLNGRNASHVRRLRTILGTDEVIVGDLTLCEVCKACRATGPRAMLKRYFVALKSYRWLAMRLPSPALAIFGSYVGAESQSARQSTS